MKQLIQAFLLLVMLTVIAGILYPFICIGIGQLFWADKVSGSLILNNDKILGSKHLAQEFSNIRYFWPRPSESNYLTLPSFASNLGPTNLTLSKRIKERRSRLAAIHKVKDKDVPEEMITASASGLDPDISFSAAMFQLNRVAEARKLNNEKREHLKDVINEMSSGYEFSIFGEKRVNVLLLNLRLDHCCGD